MKRNNLLLAICISGVSLSGCSTTHEHAFSSEWSTNELSHWHNATCEHKNLSKDLGSHIDSDNNEYCDVCGYKIGVHPAIHTVHFNTEYGSYIESQTVQSGEKVSKPEDPTRENFAFIGWYDNSSFEGEEYNFDMPVSKDLTLYALWGHSISFIDYDGTEYTHSVYKTEQETVKPIDPVREGVSFYAWYQSKDYQNEFAFGDTLESNITLYSRYAHKAELFDNEDVLFDTLLIPEDAPFNRPNDPKKDYYDFAGWFEDKERTNRYEFGHPLNDNIKLYLNFKPHHYKINYFNAENLVFDNPSEYVYGTGIEVFENKAIDSTGKDEFYGWYLEEECINKLTTIPKNMHGDINLFAKRAEIFNIEYNNWPTKIDNKNPKTYTEFDNIVFDLESIKEHPGFLNAALMENGKVITEIPLGTTGNKTIIFESELVTTKVTLDPNGGCVMPNTPFIYIDLCDGNEPIRKAVPTVSSGKSINIYDGINFYMPKQEGKVFKGYFFDPEYSCPVSEDSLNEIFVGSTIYAKWESVEVDGIIPAACSQVISVSKEEPVSNAYRYAVPYNVKAITAITHLQGSEHTTQSLEILGCSNGGTSTIIKTSSDTENVDDYNRGFDVTNIVSIEAKYYSHCLEERSFLSIFSFDISVSDYRVANFSVVPTNKPIVEEYHYWQQPNVEVHKAGYDLLAWVNAETRQPVYMKNPWSIIEPEVTLRAVYW
ncbi:MAG: InlB B-repeat-containing protein [Bacilli bacterium]|nr:InlB B-repeat-containing protein [Bacilli bacterium]